MNPEHLTSLKQAADLIKLGETKPARGLIIEVLRTDPNNAQAWYMLSFAVPNIEKQIYALQQTIRLVPDHQKAIARLEKLGGELPRTLQEQAETGPFSSREDIPTSKPSPKAIETPGDDLLSQRLFGRTTPEKAPLEQEEEKKEVKPPVFYHEIAEQAGLEEIDPDVDDADQFSVEETDQKVFGIPRKFFLAGIGILIIGLIAILGFSPH